ncbi:uracil-DNA glycosylase-like protein [Endogone sp. FLAS-F59071]|nr:uracil-DNA glycosylase-like protein [Endogone sp. FLAS-F59071]|eukprot:RUS18622.1 uracil-DNA glycosylase-like protein [Endogone sp. FLAS-F59071]
MTIVDGTSALEVGADEVAPASNAPIDAVNASTDSVDASPSLPLVSDKKRKLDDDEEDSPASAELQTTPKKTKASPASPAPLQKRQSFLTAWVKSPADSSAKPVAPKSGAFKSDPSTTDAVAISHKKEYAADDLFRGLNDELKALLKLESETMEESWLKALMPEMRKGYFAELKKFLKKEKEIGSKVFPPENQIYSWSVFTPLSKIKVVILGQGTFGSFLDGHRFNFGCIAHSHYEPCVTPDPYHDYGQAHGLCFSVPVGVRPPPSLVNIYDAIKRDIPDFVKPTHGYLEAWAKEGVLMLNASLTVRAHTAASHSGKGWETFTDAVINYLNEKKSGLVFMLWGNHAQKKGSKINQKNHLVLKTVHPSPLSVHRGFMDCKHWSQANKYLEQRGKTPVNWNCLA